MGNKLELTWYGKEEPLKIEPRLLIENVLDASYSPPFYRNQLLAESMVAFHMIDTMKVRIILKTRALMTNIIKI